MLIYVTPVSIVDVSTLSAYCISVGFVRFIGNILFKFTDS